MGSELIAVTLFAILFLAACRAAWMLWTGQAWTVRYEEITLAEALAKERA